MKHITYIISNINKALEFEWAAEHLSSEFKLSFILLNAKPSELAVFLKQQNHEVYEYIYTGKRQYFTVFTKVLWRLFKLKPNAVHCHLIDANLIGLPASWLLGIKQRFYTRHHSSFHHVYHKHAVKYDKFCNALATKVVAISNIVKTILIDWEGVNENKIVLIPHGIDVDLFSNSKASEITLLKVKYRLSNHFPLVGVISRYTHWKGLQFIIPAFKSLLIEYPNACLVLANAKNGEYASEIDLLLKLLPDNNYREIVFEPNIAQLYHCFDVFVHTPIDNHSEAFGQIYIEALAAKVPCVFTASGVSNDWQNLSLAEFVPYQDSDAVSNAIKKIIENPELYKQKYLKAYEFIQAQYTVTKKFNALATLYHNE